jgi:hypothetical protein
MKLFETVIRSGSYSHDMFTIYIVADNYCDAEKTLLSENNTFWKWIQDREIVSIKQKIDPVIISPTMEIR